jgi:Domain of unknown function (DUF397)
MIGVYSGTPASGIQGVNWRKSLRSNPSGNCVEFARLDGGAIAVRDSWHRSGPALIYSQTEAAALIARIRRGSLDRPNGGAR